MSLKTEYGYNEDDFVQKDGSMNELTVEITLTEYRNLIREQTCYEKRIEYLEEELKKAKESGKLFAQLIMIKSPETLNKICEVFDSLFVNNKADAEEGENNEQISIEENNC